MRDLSWIKNKTIHLIITNWAEFLSEDVKITEDIFIADFNKDILNHWEKDSSRHFPAGNQVYGRKISPGGICFFLQ